MTPARIGREFLLERPAFLPGPVVNAAGPQYTKRGLLLIRSEIGPRSTQSHRELIQHTRAVASDLLDEDPYLIKPENRLLREYYKELFAQTFDWSQIG